MLTPRFKLTQDENHVYLTVHAPYTNISDTEIDVDGENFLFVSSPYFLRLRLPGKIIENHTSQGSYECESGNFNLTFDKEVQGEHFDNLDMITSLLAPKDIPDVNPNLIEELENDGIVINLNENQSNDSQKSYAYGFANKIVNDFRDIGSEFPQIFELRIPEEVSHANRHSLRILQENEKFSSDHYLADYFDEELIEPYLSMEVTWDNIAVDTEFTVDEISLLKELPNKSYLISIEEKNEILLGLLDLLFGYCYDKRTTINESTVESSWTINRLSSTLSWFCSFHNTKDVLVACYRRALIYPIFRNFDLCDKVKCDVVSLMRNGKKVIVKCLIEIHNMFNMSNDARYILNQLYIKDYLVFVQQCHSEEIEELRQNLANTEITKNELNLELEELEHAAKLVQQDEIDIMENEMALKMAAMSLMPGIKKCNVISEENSDTDSDTTSDSTSTDSSSDSSTDLDSDDDLS